MTELEPTSQPRELVRVIDGNYQIDPKVLQLLEAENEGVIQGAAPVADFVTIRFGNNWQNPLTIQYLRKFHIKEDKDRIRSLEPEDTNALTDTCVAIARINKNDKVARWIVLGLNAATNYSTSQIPPDNPPNTDKEDFFNRFWTMPIGTGLNKGILFQVVFKSSEDTISAAHFPYDMFTGDPINDTEINNTLIRNAKYFLCRTGPNSPAPIEILIQNGNRKTNRWSY